MFTFCIFSVAPYKMFCVAVGKEMTLFNVNVFASTLKGVDLDSSIFLICPCAAGLVKGINGYPVH